ncbi:hypothetical protein TNCV_122691 [Trichonephila clavipes]|nr:hypothetical protein TNCV_122691 [Trichonephila clavipes]
MTRAHQALAPAALGAPVDRQQLIPPLGVMKLFISEFDVNQILKFLNFFTVSARLLSRVLIAFRLRAASPVIPLFRLVITNANNQTKQKVVIKTMQLNPAFCF